MKDPRMLSVRLSLNEAISELQDMALTDPAGRSSLEAFAAEIAVLRDRCTAGFPRAPITDPQQREDWLDNHPTVRAAE